MTHAIDDIATTACRWRARPLRGTRAIAPGVVALLSACCVLPNTAPAFLEPLPTQPSAKVRVVNLRPYAYYTDIAVFDSSSCLTMAYLGTMGGNVVDGQRIGMLDERPPTPETLERLVPAEQPLVIGPRAVFPATTADEFWHSLLPDTQYRVREKQAGVCQLPSFVPRSHEQYEVVVDLVPARCTVTPYRLVDDHGTIRREEVPTQASRISTHQFDMQCFR